MAMLQQNGGQSPTKAPFPQNQHVFPSFSAGSPAPSSQDPNAFFNNLDASSSAAKQLAALNAAGIARRATQSGGTSGTFVGGMPPPSHSQLSNHNSPFRPASAASHPSVMPTDPSLLHGVQQMPSHPSQQFMAPQDPSTFYRNSIPGVSQPMHPQHNASSLKQRQHQFLNSLAKLHEARKTPLPPSITGIPSQFDPNTSPWKSLEPASEVGGFRLAGRDIDLLKLWTLVLQFGGSAKLTQQNAWPGLLPHFGLPERFATPADPNTSTAQTLASHFLALLGPSEEMYFKNMQARLGQGQSLAAGAMHGVLPAGVNQPFVAPHTPQMRPGAGLGGMAAGMSPATPAGVPLAGANSDIMSQSMLPGGDADLDPELRKRKLGEAADLNGKRRKTDSESGQTPTHGGDTMVSTNNGAASQVPQRNQPFRRKIEYVPLAREVDSSGGRDTQMLHQEMLRLFKGRPLRDVNEWGAVHVDALMMSIRSRLAIELSYALTTMSLISTMRGNTPESGFPLSTCMEIFEEILDLLGELAFGDTPDNDVSKDERPVVTNRELIGLAQSEGELSFAGLTIKQGEHDSSSGPSQRPGDLIRICVNIIRNLSAITENQNIMGHHPVIVDLLLRLTSVERTEDGLRPLSKALSISDLVVIRKDVLGTLVNLAGSVSTNIAYENPKAITSNLRKARRIFELVSSFLSESLDSVSPYTLITLSGHGSPSRVPILVESALEVITRFGQPDANRRILVSAVPQTWIWSLFTALVHRLPVSDQDFQVVMREEAWLLYLERIVMALYSLGFQMPPAMKQRVKSDRSLGFTTLLMRLVKKFMTHSPAEYRPMFVICVRRAVEALKIIDDCNDSFDASQPNMPALAFGMGYGEVGDDSVEKGTGALGGHREDLLWGVMLQRELDEVMFMELESLTRVECA